MNLESYRRIAGYSGSTLGEVRKNQADMLMEATWDGDIQSRTCYIYDYYHDDEPEKSYKLSPQRSRTKVAIPAKYIINAYNSDGKDQVTYHIQFKPSQQNPLDYFKGEYELKYGCEFPIGLYIDIPDNKGIYRKWLIMQAANTFDPQFQTWAILPCNYRYSWIWKEKKHRMWGVSRSQSSYNSGLWRDYRVERTENQQKFVLPYNPESMSLFYNQRMIVSAPVDEGFEPIVWRISKIETTDPIGIQRVTLYQDSYNQNTDYIERDASGKVIAMWADYHASRVEPKDNEKSPDRVTSEIQFNGLSRQIKVGGSPRTFTVVFYDSDGNRISSPPTNSWEFLLDGRLIADNELNNYLTVESFTADQLRIKFIGNDDYLGSILTVINHSDDTEAKIELEITGI